jgi:hypothetical protein
MGFSPAEVDRMSPWQFAAAAAGFATIHGEPGMSEAEADEIWEWMQDRHDHVRVYH